MMTSKLIRALVASAALACMAPFASATVLTFDDLQADGLVPGNYGGLDWTASTWFMFGAEQAPFAAHSGDHRATLGWDSSEGGSSIRFNAPAQFQGAYFAGFDGVEVSFKLYLNDQLVGTSTTLQTHGIATFLASGYGGFVDRITVASNDHANFVMDDFTFSTAVPEPQSAALALAGLTVVGAIARRRLPSA
ncbi:PEP-CTERM sorting domain-containing protein [Aquabacterium sp.]|uniref:PEP-CTERM sorting domain-containing protein n=1 Tax=Aquabacterium sp. TaxID=1872578 RepID=UPI003D6D3461